MNIKNTVRTIKACMRINKPVFLWGNPGNGKTQVPKQLAAELGYTYVPLYLGQSADVADILGIMKEGDDGTFHHLRPSWFPKEEKCIIHLDEFNRCHPDLVQSMLSFLQTGKFHTHQLPANCYIMAGGNYDDENHIVTNIEDDAIKSRFVHIDVQIDLHEWLSYVEAKGCHKTVVSFIRENPEFLGAAPILSDKGGNDKVKPNPRTWFETISGLEEDDSIDVVRYEIYAGCLGRTVAAAFTQFRNTDDVRIDYKDVLYKYEETRPFIRASVTNNRLDKLNHVMEEILNKMNDNSGEINDVAIESFKKFMLDTPLELTFKVCEKLTTGTFKQKDRIVNDKVFLTELKTKKLNEGKELIKKADENPS